MIYWFFAWVTRTEDAKYKVKQVQRAATWKLGPQGPPGQIFFLRIWLATRLPSSPFLRSLEKYYLLHFFPSRISSRRSDKNYFGWRFLDWTCPLNSSVCTDTLCINLFSPSSCLPANPAQLRPVPMTGWLHPLDLLLPIQSSTNKTRSHCSLHLTLESSPQVPKQVEDDSGSGGSDCDEHHHGAGRVGGQAHPHPQPGQPCNRNTQDPPASPGPAYPSQQVSPTTA